MQLDEQEERLLRSVALQNAQAVLFAREKAERELLATREALKASNQQVTAILERISDGFAALDNQWRFTFLNHKFEEIFRRLKKEDVDFLGKNLWEEFPGLLGTEIEQHYRRAVRDQVTVEFETHLKPFNAWYLIRAYPSADGVSLYFLDISRRKTTELERARSDQALIVSEQHFRAAFNQAAVGMAVASLDGRFQEVNDRFTEILGYDREELLKHTFLDLTFPEDQPGTRDNVRKLLSGEIKEYNLEKRYIRKDGDIVWGLTSVTLLIDQAGKPDRFIGVVDDITLRKKGEERIREAAERLQLALTAGHLGDWSWDARTDLVTFGPETAEIFCLPPKTSITWKALRDLLHEEDREPAQRAVQEALATHSDYNIEYRVRHSEGHRWLAVKGRGVYATDGSVVGMIGVAQNISDRRDSEELRSRLAAVVESSDDAIITMTLDATINTWNEGAVRTFGYTSEEVVGQPIHKLLPADRQDEESLILGRILKGERVEHYETIRAHKDGHLIDVSLTVSPIFANNNLIGFSKISRDISSRKRVQQALEDESRILEILNETGRAIASELDLNKVVQIVTDSATRLSGAKFGAFFYNVTDQNGDSFMLYALSGADRKAFENYGNPRTTALFGPTFRGEGIIRIGDVTKDPRYGQSTPHRGMPKGHLPVVSYLAVPVISRDGRVIGGLFFGHPEPNVFTERAERLVAGVAAQAAIALDNASLYDAAQHEIDRRIKIEEQLRDAQETLRTHAVNLEALVSERTAKLRETIGELEAFSYSVSHDMRSPLRAMNGYSDALLEEYGAKLDDAGRDYLQRIKRAASRMDLLIQDVLAYSRVAQGDVPLMPVDLNTVINDVIQHYPSLQPDRAHITIQPDLPLVIGHEAYLTQAVSNILTNAVKFVAPGAFPYVAITGQSEDGHVRLSFKDNGIGISPEHSSRIFQIFGRVYSEKQYEGTGIGLAIAKKAAERMGGAIGVESEVGRGSCFFLTLKAAP